VAVDRDWLVTVWNRGAERMYGWSPAEVLGRRAPSFVRINLSEEERAESGARSPKPGAGVVR
jgi:PAS domain S-box-containing protein